MDTNERKMEMKPIEETAYAGLNESTQDHWQEEKTMFERLQPLRDLLDDPRTGLKDSSDTNKTRMAIFALFEEMYQSVLEHEREEGYNEGSALCKKYREEWIEKAAREEREEVCEVVKVMKETKHVRDRSFIGEGSSRKSMTGVHEEEKKNRYNEAISDVLIILQQRNDTK